MNSVETFFKGNKTYVTLSLTILGTIAAYFMGEVSLINAIYAVIASLSGIFLRSGMKAETVSIEKTVTENASVEPTHPVKPTSNVSAKKAIADIIDSMSKKGENS
ncbi:hypothetical protein M0R04_09175 [Candidatus Dojkabacteria bacterium]|jgi:hypothetical protein|nr:hypothetical protein [Candidatus Dojkabacteria bacterium]